MVNIAAGITRFVQFLCLSTEKSGFHKKKFQSRYWWLCYIKHWDLNYIFKIKIDANTEIPRDYRMIKTLIMCIICVHA